MNWIRYRRRSFATSVRSVAIAHPGKSWRQNPCSWKILGRLGSKSPTGLPGTSVAAALMVRLPDRFLKRLRNIASEKFSLIKARALMVTAFAGVIAFLGIVLTV